MKKIISFLSMVVVFSLLLVLTSCVSCNNNHDDSTSPNNDSSSSKDNQEPDSTFYTIVFQDYDGTILQETRVEEGKIPSYTGDLPVREDSDGCSYTFNKWSPILTIAKENKTYTAIYSKKIINYYTITFEDYDGTKLQEILVKEGEKPVYTNPTPTREDSEGVSYSFEKWNPTIVPATRDLKYRASYSQKVSNYYTITFKDYDGKVLQESRVKEGEMPSYNKSDPIRKKDDNYLYSFIGWSPTVAKATQNVVYTASYNSQLMPYFVNINLNGGKSSIDKLSFRTESISKDILPFDVKKKGYAFRGYEYNGTKVYDENGNVVNPFTYSSSLTFKAVFEESVVLSVYYTLYNKVDGSIHRFDQLPEDLWDASQTKVYKHNTYVDLYANPEPGYVFVGWYCDGQALSNKQNYKYLMWDEDFEIEARFEYDKYMLNIYSNNFTEGAVTIKDGHNSNVENTIDNKYYMSDATIIAYSKTDTRFLGWYDEQDELVSTNAIYSFIMPNSDYKLEARWDKFNLTYVLNGGTNNPQNPDSYSIDLEDITLETPSKVGYVFDGWQFEEESIIRIHTSFMHHMKITATWRVRDDLKPFMFDWNNGDIIITGIYDKSVSSLIIPDYVYSITGGIFSGCSNLQSITLPFVGDKRHTSSDSYQYPLGYIFGTRNYTNSNGITQYYRYSSNDTTSIAYYIPSSLRTVTITDSTFIQYGAFYNMTMLTSVILSDKTNMIPDSVTSLGESVFYNCSSLQEIVIPDSVTSIGNSVFYNCSSLKEIVIPDSVTSLGDSVFCNCSSLKEIVIPDSVTSIGNSVFYNCSSMTSITISKNVTNISSGILMGCGKLQSLTIPFVGDKRHTSSDSYQYPLGYIFGTSSYINSNGITQDYRYYSNYTTSTTYYIPSSLRTVTITDSTFIQYGAFYNMTMLTSVILSDKTNTISTYAFYGCSNLNTLKFNGTITKWNAVYKYDNWKYNSSVNSVICSNGTISV